jgi:hypothetical protein
MKRNRALAVVVCALAVTACGRRQVDGPSGVSGTLAPRSAGAEPASSGVELDRAAPPGAGTAAGGPAAAGSALDALWAEQKLIRDGRIEVEVDDVEATVARVAEVAAARRALVAGSEIRKDAAGRHTGAVTLKVPAGSFDAVFADLRGLGRVRSESTSTEDVTKQYTDLGLRLEVKRHARERLEALLATHGSDLSDLLEVERELERVVGEIEQMEGEKRYYDQRIAVSTLTLMLFEPGSAVPGPGAFAPVRVALHDALFVLAQSVAALIYLATSALPWVLLAWILWMLVRRWRRRRAARAAG